MATSRFELTGRFLAGIAAASLLAGVSGEAGASGNKGMIALRLGQTTWADGFYFYAPDTTTLDPSDYRYTGDYQKFKVEQKCLVNTSAWDEDNVPGGKGRLVDLKPIGPYPAINTNPRAGLLAGSLGVYDNSKGVSCTRMTASIYEGLFLETRVGGFDRLELDMELKGNAVFELEIVGGNTYTLRSGTNRTPGGWEGEADPGHPEVNCTGGSDSGPDSGPSDNCRWTINDVGSAFFLTPTAGEGSLEGGGDGAGVLETRIYLTSLIAVGSLGCDANDNQTAEVFGDPESLSAASCQVTRIDTGSSGIGEACTGPVDYRLETFSFKSLCQLDKTGGVGLEDQLVGLMQVTFEPEASTDWDVAQTEIKFPDQTTSTPFFAKRCGGDGTVVYDSHGNPTILEVLNGTLSGVIEGGHFVARPAGIGETAVILSDENDEVAENGYIDWACVLDHTEVFLGVGDMQISQRILYWGDISFARGAN